MLEQQLANATLEMACRTTVMNWHLDYASDRGKLNTTLNESQDEVVKLKRQLEEKRKTRSEVVGILANLEKTMAEVCRFGCELQAKNEELTKTNGEETATIKSLKGDVAKLKDYGKHLGTTYREARTERDTLKAKV